MWHALLKSSLVLHILPNRKIWDLTIPLNVDFGWKLFLCNNAWVSVGLKYTFECNWVLSKGFLKIVVSRKLTEVSLNVAFSLIEGW